jgi:hypothetical protein
LPKRKLPRVQKHPPLSKEKLFTLKGKAKRRVNVVNDF